MISQVKKRIFCPKTTKFGPNLAFLVNLGQAMQAYSVPCWWVDWWLWRVGCISQDTYLLYTIQIHISSKWAEMFFFSCVWLRPRIVQIHNIQVHIISCGSVWYSNRIQEKCNKMSSEGEGQLRSP